MIKIKKLILFFKEEGLW